MPRATLTSGGRLRDARDRRDAARKQLVAGIDPSAARRAEKAAHDDTLEAVAREWYAKHAPFWGPGHADKILRLLQDDIFLQIGARPVSAITPPELLGVLRRIETRGTGNIVHRALGIVGRVFQYAISTGRVERNLAADLRGALAPVSRGHYASITEPKEVGSLLRAIDGYRGSFAVQCALKLAALTFVRPGELRLAEWYEIVFDAAEWRIPAARMKMKAPHIVPLSRQALVILGELHSLPGVGRYVFPSAGAQLAGLPARSISENTVNAALRSMGYTKGKMTGHGFRAMARTILDEVLGVRPDIIEHQLAHMVRDPLGRAYNRTTHLPERRIMMQRWADYLDTMIKGTHS